MNAFLSGAAVAVALTAQSLAQPVIIPNVPDWHQACLIGAPNGPDGGGNPNAGTPNYRAWCTPTAVANVMGFWQDVHYFNVADGVPFVNLGVVAWAPPIPGNWQDFEADASSIPLRATLVARPFGSDLGWYLNTNDQGAQVGFPVPISNGLTPAGEEFVGTLRVNIVPGIVNYLTAHGKATASVTLVLGPAIATGWANIVSEINAGRPVLGEFDHFNLIAGPLGSGVYYWGAAATSDTQTGEIWDVGAGLGHTTTIVGYYAAGAAGNPFANTNAIVIQDSRRYSVPPAPGFPEANNQRVQMVLPFSPLVVAPGAGPTPWSRSVNIDMCTPVTGTVAGGGTICAGDTATVTVTVAGGDPPYTVTLSGGGGTQTGPSPLSFSVSPAVNTVYAFSSGTDMHGCSMTGAGSATVNVNSLPAVPTSPTATPASGCLGFSSVLSATVPAGQTVQWFTVSCGGTPVPCWE